MHTKHHLHRRSRTSQYRRWIRVRSFLQGCSSHNAFLWASRRCAGGIERKFIAYEDFPGLMPLVNLTVYEWHSRTAKDYFCPHCGIMPFRIPSALTPEELAAGRQPFEGWAVNARCLEGIDLSDVPVELVNGADLS